MHNHILHRSGLLRLSSIHAFSSSFSIRRMGSLPRLRIVMDLDECMVHSKDLLYSKNRENSKIEQFNLAKKHKGNGAVIIEDFAVYIRPNLTSFLQGISEVADVYAYTAGSEGYAKHVFDHLDPEQTVFQRILYRHNCVPVRGPIRSYLIPLNSGHFQYLKDLRRFGDEIFIPQRTVLVDNNPISFQLQPENGLLVPDYTAAPGQRGDDHLLRTLDVLRHLSTLPDVRPFLTNRFQVTRI